MTTQENGEPNVVGDFRIEKRIGSGGMGVVYQARQISLDRVVAFKTLGGALRDPGSIARFQREAQAAAKLNHPSIASIHYVGQDAGVCYMAMEYVDGISLREVIDRLDTMSSPERTLDAVVHFASADIEGVSLRFDKSADTEEHVPIQHPSSDPTISRSADTLAHPQEHIHRCCELIRDASRGLQHAHSQGVVHRDIKPDNMMVDRNGQIHIIDFGIARFFEDATLTHTGQLVGTPLYMSPEQVTGRIDLDHRTDIYSLGVVLYELLTLRRPLADATREGILRKIATKALVPVSWHNRFVPRRLESVVHKAAARDPEERYQSAEEFAGDLQRYLDNETVSAPPYRYRFDEREIVLERPTSVTVASLLSFAIFCYGSMWGASVLIASRAIERTAIEYVAGGLLCPLGITGVFAAYHLLTARPWSRWFTIVCAALSGMALVYNWFVLLGQTARTAIHLMAGSFYLPSTLTCTAIVIILLRRRTSDWFGLAYQLRQEYQQQQTSRPTLEE